MVGFYRELKHDLAWLTLHRYQLLNKEREVSLQLITYQQEAWQQLATPQMPWQTLAFMAGSIVYAVLGQQPQLTEFTIRMLSNQLTLRQAQDETISARVEVVYRMLTSDQRSLSAATGAMH